MNSLCLWFPFILLHSGAPKEIFLGGARENRFFFFSELTFWIFPASFQVDWKMRVIVWEKKIPSLFHIFPIFKSKISMVFRSPKVFISCLGSAVLIHSAPEKGWELYDVSDPSWLKLSEKSSQTLFSCKKNGILLCQKVNRAIMFWPQQIFKQGQKKSRSMMAFSCAIDCYGNPIAKSFGIWKPGQLLFLKP